MPTFRAIDPCQWYGRLQRAYLATAHEAVLEELADLGRLLAVTGFPIETVLEAHSAVLAEALAEVPPERLAAVVQDASICLSEVLVACRAAGEGIGGTEGAIAADDAPVFLCFEDGGRVEKLRAGEEPALARMMDIASLAELGRVLGPSRAEELERAIQACRLSSFEFRPPSAPGRMVRAVVCPFRDGSGIIGIHDVTARRAAAEAEFQRRKLESLGQLAGGIAHEFNNLLQPILMTAQFIAEDYSDDPRLSADVAIVLDSARAAAEVVHGILAFARRPATRLERQPMAEAVERELAATRSGLPAGIRLTLDLAACGDAAVLCNRVELGQVLRNLVGNAADALAGHGHIAISADTVQVGRGGVLPAGRYVRLAVADDGPGVDAAAAERVFEPFYTTKDIGKGTGLGLAVVRSIVHGWSGTVALRPDAGGGAVFEILLPLAADMPLPAPTAGMPTAGWPGASIIVVDDNDRVRGGVVRTLERAGYRVRGFDRSAAALAALSDGAVDLLVTDLVMEGTDGFAFVKAARRVLGEIPSIVLTGGCDGSDLARQAECAGVTQMLLKPIATDDLLSAVAACLVGRGESR